MPRTPLALVAAVLSASSAAMAVDINVPGDVDTIQEGIDIALPGDVVIVGLGVWSESIDFLGKPITVRSADGPQVTTIDAMDLGEAAVYLVSGEGPASVLDGFTVTRGIGQFGGGVVVENGGTPLITNCKIVGNSANFGGGVFVSTGGSPVFVNCIIASNSASGFGSALFSNQAEPRLINCTVTGNIGGSGVLFSVASNVRVENSIIWGNAPSQILGVNPMISYSDVQGGWPGVANINADPRFRDVPAGDYRLGRFSPCIDAGNNAAIAGFDADVRANARLFDDLFVPDTGSGGAPVVDMGAIERPIGSDRMVVEPGDPIQPVVEEVKEGELIGVLPGVYEGPIDFGGKSITLVSTEGPGSTAIVPPQGGAGPLVLFTMGEGVNSVLDGFTIVGGSAPQGGGMIIVGAEPTVVNCIFRDNLADTSGGALAIVDGAPDIIDCVFIDNRIAGSFAPGGGIFGGGAISNENSAPTITNCTFLRNDGVEVGGGILNDFASAPRITNCLLWDNTPDQINGPVTLVSYSNVQGGFVGPNNIDLDPLVVDEFGRLGPGSPCVDAGDTTALPTSIFEDPDGAPRFVDDPDTENTGEGEPPVDIGAFEFQGVVDLCIEDLSDNDAVDVADIIALLPAWGECDGCREDLNNDGVVDFGDILLILAAWGPCPDFQVGACCLSFGGCEILDEYECSLTEGTFQGPGTDCKGEECDPPFGGACCLPDFSCIEVFDEGECVEQQGEYRGDGTNCASESCEG